MITVYAEGEVLLKPFSSVTEAEEYMSKNLPNTSYSLMRNGVTIGKKIISRGRVTYDYAA
jgi:hypothetical protein